MTPCRGAILEKTRVAQLVKRIAAVYGTGGLIIMFSGADYFPPF